MSFNRVFRIVVALLVLLVGVNITNAQKLTEEKLDAMAAKYAQQSFPMLKELLSIPNDAIYPKDIEKNIQWCESAFGERKFTTTRIETSTVPLLLAERKVKKPKKTVLIYLQIDGQPVDTTRWFQDSPYIPALKMKTATGEWEEMDWSKIENYDDDWRVFARSTSDAKGPAAMFLAAIDAIDDNKISPNFDMKVIMDFEEELGSPRLPQAVIDNKELLKSDMLVIFDGPMHITNKPTLVFGARGIATIQLTTYGPIAPQHSGHYGNYAPNPAFRLS
uniref:M20/M25/M40 family metallo-hydrolase n=1 Tax=Fulvivirga sp. TaxID=1931237 RepID=UPI004049525A